MSHGASEHPPHLQHHFETSEQQFDAGKLGIWLFLATEILLFGGLFCAYAIYRANHPEIFIYAHQYLDKVLGGTNTIIRRTSSITSRRRRSSSTRESSGSGCSSPPRS